MTARLPAITSSAPCGDDAPMAPLLAGDHHIMCCGARLSAEAQPELTFAALNRTLGEMWKSLGPDGQRPWQDAAAAEKLRVAAEVAAMDPKVGAAAAVASFNKEARRGAVTMLSFRVCAISPNAVLPA
jgi:HMG (high mobility group) box